MDRQNINPQNRVPNNKLLSYAIGLAGQNISCGYIFSWIRYFCINLLHINPDKVGKAFFVTYFWDAVNDPIIGGLTDRRRFKSGEKLRPYLLTTPPILGVLSVLMFLNVPFDETGKIIYILLAYFAWDFVYSFQDVALWGMVATSSPLSEERSRVAQWVSIGAGAGGAIAGTFQMLRSTLLNTGMSDMQIFMLFAFIFAMGGELISMAAYRMPEYVRSQNEEQSFLSSISILRHNRNLLLISLARFLTGFSPKVQNAYFFENLVSFNVGSKHIDGMMADFLFGIVTGIPGALAIFFTTKFAKKVGGMKRILLIAQTSSVILRIVSYFVGYQSFWQVTILILLMALNNIPNSMLDIAHRSLTSDSIDHVEWKTGIRSEGISFSMQNFTTKLTGAVQNYIEGKLLSKLKYSSADKSLGKAQNAVFLKWQWPMFILGPAIGSVLYLIAISFVKDDPDEKEMVELELIKRREEKMQKQKKDKVLAET